MSILTIPWPYARRTRTPVVPCFLPFAGCKVRCLYCAQNIQTGRKGDPSPIPALEECSRMLSQRRQQNLPPAEAAFYGGTFTGQKQSQLSLCLNTAKHWLSEGLITGWRCSTRPDCLSEELLLSMKNAGCRTVELGIQSFSSQVLNESLRNYTPETARAAIRLVRTTGLSCGVQLLPGLPGSTPEEFLDDVRTAIRLGANFFRFYPCLVIRSTGLAKLYEAGKYSPWNMDTAIAAMADGLALAGEARTPVIRIGVAWEKSLVPNVLAGPWDPSLGERAYARLLCDTLEHAIPDRTAPVHISIPKFTQGYLYGYKGENKARLQHLGIIPSLITWSEDSNIQITLP